ncbi:hypothetical protein C8Q73DRAFT_153316 [Cubamyces lactineus]|nr:hypothetical protein C8Q73DRAFT_153316 [Cubamyces lactineus]
MQEQHDPFQVGGSITSAKLDGSMIITNLVTGSACMSFLSAFHWDWSLLKGRVGCRPGAFGLYFGCRYLAISSMFSTIMFLNAFPVTLLNPLRYIAQATAGVALGLSYSIFLIRIAVIFKNVWVSAVLDLLKVIFWAIVWKQMGDVPWIHRPLGTQLAMFAYCAVVSMLSFFTLVVHVMYVRKDEHHFRAPALARALWRGDVPEYALLCASATVAAIISFIDWDPSGCSNFTAAYVDFSITTFMACRVYRNMAVRLDRCPSEFCVSLRCARALGRLAGMVLSGDSRSSRDGHPSEADGHSETRAKKRCVELSFGSCLSCLWQKPPRISERSTRSDAAADVTEQQDPEAATGGLDNIPLSTIHSARSSHPTGSLQAPSQHAPRKCFQNSRSTYANTSLYQSQEG